MTNANFPPPSRIKISIYVLIIILSSLHLAVDAADLTDSQILNLSKEQTANLIRDQIASFSPPKRPFNRATRYNFALSFSTDYGEMIYTYKKELTSVDGVLLRRPHYVVFSDMSNTVKLKEIARVTIDFLKAPYQPYEVRVQCASFNACVRQRIDAQCKTVHNLWSGFCDGEEKHESQEVNSFPLFMGLHANQARKLQLALTHLVSWERGLVKQDLTNQSELITDKQPIKGRPSVESTLAYIKRHLDNEPLKRGEYVTKYAVELEGQKLRVYEEVYSNSSISTKYKYEAKLEDVEVGVLSLVCLNNKSCFTKHTKARTDVDYRCCSQTSAVTPFGTEKETNARLQNAFNYLIKSVSTQPEAKITADDPFARPIQP